MEYLGFLLSLLAAFCYGINPTIIGKIKTKSYQQAIGTIFTLFIFGTIMFLINWNTSISNLSTFATTIIVISAFSGICYAIGQTLQYMSLEYLGTSKGFAFSTAFILIFNSIFSLILFNDWNTTSKLLLGFGSIAIIIVGAFVLAIKEKKEKVEESEEIKKENKKKFIKGIIICLIEGIIFGLYLTTPSLLLKENTFTIFGFGPFYVEGLAPTTILIFQSGGSLITILLIALFIHIKDNKKAKENNEYEKTILFNKRSLLAIIPGIFQSVGNLSLTYAAPMIGTAIANSMAQICAAFSTIFALLILKEYVGKTKKEVFYMILGSVLVAVGGISIGFTAYV